MTVTFNPNQLRSHLLPLLALPEVGTVTLVSDVDSPPLAKLTTVVPPTILRRCFGRAGAKLILCAWLALRTQPQWIIGFNFIPHGLNARLVGGLSRARSLYHMIGGELEWLGGGWMSDNRLLARLPRPVPALERMLFALVKGCTVTATMGEFGRRALLERGLAPERVWVMRPSVDTERFRPGRHDGFGLYDLVNVGSLIRRKRTSDLIEAISLLRPRHPGLRAAIVGEGPLEAELKAQARSCGVADCIDFLGQVEEIEKVYAGARAFVLPSAYEGLPVAMLEAMASGVPPVVTGVGEIPAFVRDQENGFVVPPGDPAALADALDLVLSDEQRRAAVGAAAARDVRARASVEVVSQEYRRLFRAFA